MGKYGKWVTYLWLAFVVAFWTYALIFEMELTPESLAEYLKKFSNYILVAYALFTVLRAFTLIPNMTVVLVGTLILPGRFWTLLIISVIGLLASSSIIYFFGEEMGLDVILRKKFPDKEEYIKRQLDKYGDWIVFFWGFLPVVPSDLLSFVLGIVKYKYWKFILFYGLSHFISYAVIIKFGEEFWKWVF